MCQLPSSRKSERWGEFEGYPGFGCRRLLDSKARLSRNVFETSKKREKKFRQRTNPIQHQNGILKMFSNQTGWGGGVVVRLLNSGTKDPRFESLYLFVDEHQVTVSNSYKKYWTWCFTATEICVNRRKKGQLWTNKTFALILRWEVLNKWIPYLDILKVSSKNV